MVLSDILPDWVFHEVLSFGDLVLSMGIAAVVVNLLRPPTRHRRDASARLSENAAPSANGSRALRTAGAAGRPSSG